MAGAAWRRVGITLMVISLLLLALAASSFMNWHQLDAQQYLDLPPATSAQEAYARDPWLAKLMFQVYGTLGASVLAFALLAFGWARRVRNRSAA
ncbi:hypothetical protein FGE12_26595 [Aggregicoccus sp. 17bor-14]|uniref:hypothetical protein n=1 Tax=Myxococcaceae TaxID=31 RepID=UPI00129D147E|nr:MULTISPECIES: hypothetical protein [Myxococcaceae]MBF5046010.1 hypothetical protein [Simulacricoccus sp. 17bor-14]MRI91741.1 hypothetical protein [Aggregicoccus sp. 17bor-14]